MNSTRVQPDATVWFPQPCWPSIASALTATRPRKAAMTAIHFVLVIAGPVEDGAPLEVATALDQRDSGDRGDGIPPVAHRLIGPHDPSPVCLGDEDRGVAEGLAPLDAHAVKMRMRHRDAAQPTSVPNCGEARIVDKAQAVPEDIAGSRLHQQRPLADSNRWIRADPGQSRFEVADVSTPAFRPKLLERR